MRILIADDNANMRHLLRETLRRAGYEVLEAENGREALEHLSSIDGPRLALLDWLMPDVDGVSVCREVRKRSVFPYVYIILLSARTSKEDIVSGLEAGADDYLTKPFHADELKARLRAGERILKLEDKLVHDALHDPLTQLPNRTHFLDRLAHCVKRGMRHADSKFAVLLVDMDRFKVVNDSLGNAAGDWLLTQIAERLFLSIRREDTVSRSGHGEAATGMQNGDGMLARLEGDKFTILLDRIQNASDGIRVAERIQRKIQTPYEIDGQQVFTTASIGIAYGETGYSSAADMLGDAHTAMYRAKALGKSQYQVCDSTMHADATGRFGLEADLRRATSRGEFRVHYQPIVALGDCRIIGFEALVRWQRPKFGLVMPEGFISVAEDTGLILPIGSWVLREACRQMRAWNQEFPAIPEFTVAVNISAKQFVQPDLVAEVGQILNETGLAAHSLKLELTESVTMRDEERTNRILRDLRSLGVRLCMDDFGTGFSSLSYLRRFDLDILKIDRSFVSEMMKNSESREIVKTVLSLGQNLGMEAVAEGAETAEQVNMLRSLGCEYAQGYFFSRPVDRATMEATLLKLRERAYRLPQGSPFQVAPAAS